MNPYIAFYAVIILAVVAAFAAFNADLFAAGIVLTAFVIIEVTAWNTIPTYTPGIKHRISRALHCNRQWKAHALSDDHRWVLGPAVEVMYIPVSSDGRGGERPGQVWLSLRFLSCSAGVGFFFWHDRTSTTRPAR